MQEPAMTAARAAEIARMALKRMAELQLPPTPANFERQYFLVAGKPLPNPATRRREESPELVSMVSSIMAILDASTTGIEEDCGRFQADTEGFLSELSRTSDTAQAQSIIEALATSAIALRKATDESRRELAETQRMVSELNEELAKSRTLSQVDPLTGTYNRRGLDLALGREVSQLRRNGGRLAVVLLDIDHFKGVNDRHGHEGGDQALVHVASVCRASVRDSDVIARYGGEEFVLLMPDTDGRGAHFVADRMRMMLERTPLQYGREKLVLHFSAGVTEWQAGDSAATLLRRADEAMYRAKEAGRNRVLMADLPLAA